MSDYGTTSKVVKARKEHRCGGDWGHDRTIHVGEFYTRSVCFPGHDANGGTTPSVIKLCTQCRPVSGNPKEPAEEPITSERYFGVAGHCHDIDGWFWHEPGTCKGASVNCNGRCCGYETFAVAPDEAQG